MTDDFSAYFYFTLCDAYMYDIIDLLEAQFGLDPPRALVLDRYLELGWCSRAYYSSVCLMLQDHYRNSARQLMLSFYDWASDLIGYYTMRYVDYPLSNTLALHLSPAFLQRFCHMGEGPIQYTHLGTRRRYAAQEKATIANNWSID